MINKSKEGEVKREEKERQDPNFSSDTFAPQTNNFAASIFVKVSLSKMCAVRVFSFASK